MFRAASLLSAQVFRAKSRFGFSHSVLRQTLTTNKLETTPKSTAESTTQQLSRPLIYQPPSNRPFKPVQFVPGIKNIQYNLAYLIGGGGSIFGVSYAADLYGHPLAAILYCLMLMHYSWLGSRVFVPPNHHVIVHNQKGQVYDVLTKTEAMPHVPHLQSASLDMSRMERAFEFILNERQICRVQCSYQVTNAALYFQNYSPSESLVTWFHIEHAIKQTLHTTPMDQQESKQRMKVAYTEMVSQALRGIGVQLLHIQVDCVDA